VFLQTGRRVADELRLVAAGVAGRIAAVFQPRRYNVSSVGIPLALRSEGGIQHLDPHLWCGRMSHRRRPRCQRFWSLRSHARPPRP
jgi:hypothetical protein